MSKSKDPLSAAVDTAFGIASTAISIAAQQVRNVAGSSKEQPDEAAKASSEQLDLERAVEVVLEREGVARQEELAALRRSIAALQAELSSTHEEIHKLRRKIKNLKGKNDES